MKVLCIGEAVFTLLCSTDKFSVANNFANCDFDSIFTLLTLTIYII